MAGFIKPGESPATIPHPLKFNSEVFYSLVWNLILRKFLEISLEAWLDRVLSGSFLRLVYWCLLKPEKPPSRSVGPQISCVRVCRRMSVGLWVTNTCARDIGIRQARPQSELSSHFTWKCVGSKSACQSFQSCLLCSLSLNLLIFSLSKRLHTSIPCMLYIGLPSDWQAIAVALWTRTHTWRT